jgi:hypothetical protein
VDEAAFWYKNSAPAMHFASDTGSKNQTEVHMDLAKIGEVRTVQYRIPDAYHDREISGLLRDGWVILVTRIVDTERGDRNVWPTTAVYILGKPRERLHAEQSKTQDFLAQEDPVEIARSRSCNGQS